MSNAFAKGNNGIYIEIFAFLFTQVLTYVTFHI